MKFTCSVDIDLPRDSVVKIFDNPENMQYWQDGFISFEPKSGKTGQNGSKSIVKYDIKGRKIDLLETVTLRNLPDEFHGSYEGDYGKNTMNNYFEILDKHKTRWRSEVEYTEMNHFMMKVMAKLMPSMFKKQTQKWMDQFKVFAEQEDKA